jgi:hypothetical protein
VGHTQAKRYLEEALFCKSELHQRPTQHLDDEVGTALIDFKKSDLMDALEFVN